MRILISLAVLSLAGTGWWVSQPTSVDGVQAALMRVSSAPPAAAASISAAAPTLAEDLERLPRLVEVIDRPALDAVAHRLARALEDDPSNGPLNMALCTASRLIGDAEAAVAFGERATACLPEHSEAHLQHAKALGELMRVEGLFSAMKHLGTYKSLIARAIELDSHNHEARVAHIGFLVFAPGLVGGDLEEARRLADELESVDPRHAGIMRALALAQDDQLGEALAVCEETLAAFPGDQTLHVTLARLLQEMGRGEEAVLHYEAVLTGPRTEKYYQALYHRGVLRIEGAVDLDLALAAFERYAEAAPYGDFLPDVAGAHWRQGQVHERLGRVERARTCYETALAADPDFEQAEDALDSLVD